MSPKPRPSAGGLRLLSTCLAEVKTELEKEMSFDDPAHAVLQTITAEDIKNTGIIKTGYTKAKIKKAIADYIPEHVRALSRKQVRNNLFDSLRKDSGLRMTTSEQTEDVSSDSETPSIDSQEPTTSRDERTHEGEVVDEDTFEDELVPDPMETEISRNHPALPRTPCPPNLFVGTLRYKYLNSLFTTDRQSFPKQWNRIKNSDPEAAWHSLNQTMIPFLNKRWENQGVMLGMTETPVDYLSFSDLKASIIQTIRETKKDQNEGTSTSAGTEASGQRAAQSDTGPRLERCIGRLEESIRVITSYAAKTTGREVFPPSAPSTAQPYLSGATMTRAHSKVSVSSDSDADMIIE